MASTKILIIDDEQDVIDLLTLHLRKAGFALRTANDGAAGLRMAREESPALKDEKMDRFGNSPDGEIRYLIGPYIFYRTEDDLYPFDTCATSKKVAHECRRL